MTKKQSPFKKLIDAQEELNLPVKVTPTKRTVAVEKPEPIDGEIVAADTEVAANRSLSINDSGLAINNSSLTINLNLNLDSKAVDRAVQQSAKIAKGLAASAAAMIGTAFIFSTQEKKVNKTKIPLMPKVKVPKMD